MATTEEAGPSKSMADPSSATERDIASTDEFLMRLVTLCASLSGAAIFLLTDISLGLLFRLAFGSLILGVLCALKGRLMSATDSGATPAADLLRWKKRCAELSAAALVAGLCLAAGGVLLR